MINGSVELEWGDGEHTFNVAKIAQALELEEKCGTPEHPVGIFEIFQRLSDRKARVNDIREVIRLGLIGGGKTPIQALGLVKRYVDDRPLIESMPVARTIVMAAIVGVPGDVVGKKQEADRAATEESQNPSSDPASMASGPQSDLPQDKLMKSHSGNSSPVLTAGTGSTVLSSRTSSL